VAVRVKEVDLVSEKPNPASMLESLDDPAQIGVVQLN
jgi:hypothetical protein